MFGGCSFLVLVCPARKSDGVSSFSHPIFGYVWFLVFLGFRVMSFNLGVGLFSLFFACIWLLLVYSVCILCAFSKRF